ncbi:MAG: FAD-dependent oxidoreductase, partial [Candidatus Thiodiazotropha sp. (ex Lucinoma borealis)]|nr:FAD-dependent oxidoreductase [Candidatus Thiodiazotropha sp. (ex Lucinoma borealis)]
YPAMPVIIKTPLHPIVIAAPDPKAEGNWQTEQTNEGTRCLYHGVGDDLLGFVISGRFVEEKQALSQRLPPLLPASI